jgi:hypothetical protein
MPLQLLLQRACQPWIYLEIENKIGLCGNKYGGYALLN